MSSLAALEVGSDLSREAPTREVREAKERNTNQIFEEARTHSAWLDKPVSDHLLYALYDKMKWGPTSINASPARIVFIKSGLEKEKLLTAMSPGNIEKTKNAPVTAIIAYDTKFYDQLPLLFPHVDLRGMFADNEQAATDLASFNTAMQSAYFIVAARALGLDCGPMAGFDKTKLDEIFFKDTNWRATLVINLGYGDYSKLFPRGPRLSFEEACRIL